MQDYLFFFSYSREHWKGGLLEEFLKDLETAVLQRLDTRPTAATYFLDQEDIEGGDRWRPVLVNALQASRLILPVYAPGYFSRSVCGQEVELFLSRQRAAGQEGYILPIYWMPPPAIPPALNELQYWWKELPESYKTKGLEGIARKKTGLFHDDYQDCITALASRVVELLKKPALPALAPAPALAQITDAFAPAPPAPVVPGAAPPLPTAGPDNVTFALVAGSRTEFLARKASINYYGNRHLEWRPFLDQKLNLGALAQSLAVNRNFVSNAPLVIDQQLLQQIAGAEQQNSILIFLVDSWSLHLIDRYEQLMQQVDLAAAQSLSTAVLVLWNEQDPDEQPPMPDTLRAQIRNTFARQDTRDAIYFRGEIRSRADFEAVMADSLIRIQDKIIQKIQDQELLKKSPLRQKPNLENAAA